MKKTTKITIGAVLALIIITNLPPISFFFQENYSYQNEDGSFKYQEQSDKGLDFEVCKIRFERFNKENPDNANKKLYRTFAIKPWKFWEWWEMLSNYERFKLPLLNNADAEIN
ncbi:hypothetical protein EA772_01690 [Pedobacter sp. G11]|uniref:hypothetical protein n=1 Tax=Pedobacter sp. G11 TaxID=2482728 RepID=UPI000F5DCA2F|nr:hypothetical protein [Pedobacter sp. G11]AZI24117.1 hypothetical protein EA772_01690 [Pedobacter sp. G11]